MAFKYHFYSLAQLIFTKVGWIDTPSVAYRNFITQSLILSWQVNLNVICFFTKRKYLLSILGTSQFYMETD